MGRNNNESIWRKCGFRLSSALLAILTAVITLTVMHFYKPPTQESNVILEYVVDYGWNWSFGFFVATGVFWIIKVGMEQFKFSYIDPFITEHENAISKHTESITNVLESIHEETEKLIKNNSLDLAIAHADSEAISSRLAVLHEKVFGEHCSREQGLYAAIKGGVGKFLDPRVPHRSATNREITVIDEGEGKVKWSEESVFHLHCIFFDKEFQTPFDDEQVGDINYKFRYKTQAIYTDVEHIELAIYVDDQLLVSSQGKIRLVTESPLTVVSDDPNVSVNPSFNDEIQISLDCNIPIKKAMTKVKIKEVSYLEDDYYVCHLEEPSYGTGVSITLPDGWEFDYLHTNKDGYWDVSETASNKRTISRLRGWTMPGMLMSCRWIRKS